MPNITNLTLDQLRAMTGAQIIAAIDTQLNAMTKRQIMVWLLDTERVTTTTLEHDAQGRQARLVEQALDVETGIVVSNKEVSWSYYATGEVKDIVVTAGTNQRTIRHYRDGRQPTVSEQQVEPIEP